MYQPRKWWVGLVPLALVFFVAQWRTTSPVEGDLVARAGEELKRAGLSWAKPSLAGRDAVVSGVAPEPGMQQMALDTVERAWGVRRVASTMTVLPEQKPYLVSATRDGTKITLTGSVPNDEARAAAITAAKAAFANAEVVDQRVLARGAPASYGAGLAHGLAQLGRLARGTAALSDSALSVTGAAADFAGFDAVTAALKALPAGSTLAKAEITPPRMSPFDFNAVKSAAGIALSGVIPAESARAAIIAAARTAAGTGTVTDGLRVADGAPAGVDFGGAAGFALAQLGRLTAGTAKISDQNLSLAGAAASVPVHEAVTGALGAASLPGGIRLASQAVTGPTQSPYTWSAKRDAAGLTLAGYIPSEQLRTGIVNSAKALFPNVNVIDQMQLALGAPNGFANAVTAALGQLAKLASGSATLTNAALALSGEALQGAAADQVRGALASGLPPGFTGTTAITVRPPPPPPPPPPAPPPAPPVAAAPANPNIIVPALPPLVLSALAQECQDKFNALLAKEKILFASGRADIQEESDALIRALAEEAKRCPAARIDVQGHTDSDGAPEANKSLSERRAGAVVNRLADYGIEKQRLGAMGFGETRPVAANDTAENKAKNRRIEFSVSE